MILEGMRCLDVGATVLIRNFCTASGPHRRDCASLYQTKACVFQVSSKRSAYRHLCHPEDSPWLFDSVSSPPRFVGRGGNEVFLEFRSLDSPSCCTD